ncbi:MAG: thioredoxin family protein [Candidatus Omnitrophica bacterium]|jgi:hypothetical protein|nr:thioredoxin family protein [Candidatus Omnitrophota bacterium]
MAEIKKIEIICFPCHRCEVVKEKIQNILKCLEFKFGKRMTCELILYDNRKEAMAAASRMGCSTTQFPATYINGELAFIGNMISEQNIRKILETILRI